MQTGRNEWWNSAQDWLEIENNDAMMRLDPRSWFCLVVYYAWNDLK